MKRRNKYNAKKTVIDGITFDSKAESNYYAMLKIREKAGEISNIELQKPYLLLADNDVLVATYKADFAFHDYIENRYRVIDVKGFDTPLSRHKRKHVKAQYGIDVEIVK